MCTALSYADRKVCAPLRIFIAGRKRNRICVPLSRGVRCAASLFLTPSRPSSADELVSEMHPTAAARAQPPIGRDVAAAPLRQNSSFTTPYIARKSPSKIDPNLKLHCWAVTQTCFSPFRLLYVKKDACSNSQWTRKRERGTLFLLVGSSIVNFGAENTRRVPSLSLSLALSIVASPAHLGWHKGSDHCRPCSR